MAVFVTPGQNPIEEGHLVLDFNGTLAVDGVLVSGVAERLRELALTPNGLAIHVVTADTSASRPPSCLIRSQCVRVVLSR